MMDFIFIRGIIKKGVVVDGRRRNDGKMEDISFLTIKTKEQILKELEISRKQAENGQYQDFDTVLDEVCQELGV